MTPLLLFFKVPEARLLIDAFSDPAAPTGMLTGGALLSGRQEAGLLALPTVLFFTVVNYALVSRRQKHHEYCLRLSRERTDILHRDF